MPDEKADPTTDPAVMFDTLVNFVTLTLKSLGHEHGPDGTPLEDAAPNLVAEEFILPVVGNRGDGCMFTTDDLRAVLSAAAEWHLMTVKGENWREAPGRF